MSDFNNMTSNGVYTINVTTDTQNSPPDPSLGTPLHDWFSVFVQQIAANSNYLSQIAYSNPKNLYWVRRRRDGVWGSWQMLITQSVLPVQFVQSSQTVNGKQLYSYTFANNGSYIRKLRLSPQHAYIDVVGIIFSRDGLYTFYAIGDSSNRFLQVSSIEKMATYSRDPASFFVSTLATDRTYWDIAGLNNYGAYHFLMWINGICKIEELSQ